MKVKIKKGQVNLQIGKNGLSSGFIESLENAFKTRENVKVHVLKSARQDKEEIKEIAEEIVEELGKNYTYKIVGFTIFLKKWKKVKR